MIARRITYFGQPAVVCCDAKCWCIRECERSAMTEAGHPDDVVEARDFSRRRYNMPWLHKADG